jgi:hypothetical protein
MAGQERESEPPDTEHRRVTDITEGRGVDHNATLPRGFDPTHMT